MKMLTFPKEVIYLKFNRTRAMEEEGSVKKFGKYASHSLHILRLKFQERMRTMQKEAFPDDCRAGALTDPHLITPGCTRYTAGVT